MKRIRVLALPALVAAVVLVAVFSPITPFTKTQNVAEHIDIWVEDRYWVQFAPGRTGPALDSYIRPLIVADIVNRRAADGWVLAERIPADLRDTRMLLFTRRVPWYEPAPVPPPTPAPLPTRVPLEPTKAPAVPARAPTASEPAKAPTKAPAATRP